MPEKVILNEMEIILCEEKQKEILTEIKISDQSDNSIHNIVNKIENISIKAATTCNRKGRKTPKRKTNTKKINKHKPWYNKDRNGLKRLLNKLWKSFTPGRCCLQ